MNCVVASDGEGVNLLPQTRCNMLSCPLVGHQNCHQDCAKIQPKGSSKKLKENTCDHMYNECQDDRDVEAKKWDSVDDKPSRAHGEGNCCCRTHDASTKLRGDHNKDSDPIAEKNYNSS